MNSKSWEIAVLVFAIVTVIAISLLYILGFAIGTYSQVGPKGPKGPKGDKGDRGVKGLQGEPGLPGKNASKAQNPPLFEWQTGTALLGPNYSQFYTFPFSEPFMNVPIVQGIFFLHDERSITLNYSITETSTTKFSLVLNRCDRIKPFPPDKLEFYFFAYCLEPIPLPSGLEILENYWEQEKAKYQPHGDN